MSETSLAVETVTLSVGPITQLLLAMSLAFTMLTVATGLRTQDFAFVRAHPTSIFIGFCAQVVALPVITLFLIKVLQVSSGLALGMIIVAACPGGAMSNLITKIAGADAAYSVALTMLSSVFSALLLPVAILFWISFHAPASGLIDQINIDRTAFVIRTTLILLVPLGLGLGLSQYKPALSAKLHKKFMPISVMILFILIIAGLIANKDILLSHGAQMVPLVVLHNAVAFLIGGLIGYTFLKDRRKSRALVFEVGIQNAGLGLIIVMAELGGVGEAALLVGTWSIWHLIGGFTLANLFRYSDRRKTADAS